MPSHISDDERERAVLYLIGEIPELTLMRIYEEFYTDPDWLVGQHFGIGMQVRNLLRVGGFVWSDTVLDREWEPILFEAARRIYADSS